MSPNWKLQMEKPCVEFGRTEVSVRLCIWCKMLRPITWTGSQARICLIGVQQFRWSSWGHVKKRNRPLIGSRGLAAASGATNTTRAALADYRAALTRHVHDMMVQIWKDEHACFAMEATTPTTTSSAGVARGALSLNLSTSAAWRRPSMLHQRLGAVRRVDMVHVV